MAETQVQDYISVPYTPSAQAPQSPGKEVILFSTTGDRKGAGEFQLVADQYERYGTTPAGYTALDADSFQTMMRSGFEKVNQPLQQVGQQIANPQLPQGIIDPRAQAAQQQFQQSGLGKVLGLLGRATNPASQVIGQQIEGANTPEKAAVTAALGATNVGTLGKLLGQTSGILPSLGRGAVAGLTSAGAQALTGTAASESPNTPVMQRAFMQPIAAALSVIGAEGVQGALTRAIGSSLGQQAMAQAQQGILNMIKKDYPSLSLSGKEGVDAVASTKAGLDKIISEGVKAVKGDGENAAKQFVDDINAVLPLGKVATKHIDRVVTEYRELVNEALDNIGDTKKSQELYRKAGEKATDLTKLIASEFKERFPRLSPEKHVQNLAHLQEIMMQYKTKEMGFRGAAKVIEAIKNSNPGGGFDLKKFQQYVEGPQGFAGGETLENVAGAASRGQIGGVDRSLNRLGSMEAMKAAPGWLQTGARLLGSLPAGTRYTGKVANTPDFVPMDIAVANEVSNFMTREKK